MEDTQYDDAATALGAHATREVYVMDIDRFDELTRRLAATGSRRRVLAALAGGLFAAWSSRRVGATDHKDKDKVALCHRTNSDTNAIVVIEVGVNAVPDHLAHGDVRYTDCCLDGDCGKSQACIDGSCQDTCQALGATCDGNNECCQIGETAIRCDVAGCGGTHCCHPGAGSCSNDCDCCGSHCCDMSVPGEKGVCDNDCGFD